MTRVKQNDVSAPEVAVDTFDVPGPGSSFAELVLRATLCAVLFGLAAYASLRFTSNSSHIAAVWLPNALLVAYLFHQRVAAPASFIGAAFVANLIASVMIRGVSWQALGLPTAHCIEIVIVYWGMVRRRSTVPDLQSLPDLYRLGLYGGLIGPAASALIATLVLAPTTLLAGVEALGTWMMTDGLGMVIIAPSVTILWQAWDERARPSRETLRAWLIVFAFGTTVTVGVFAQSELPLLFLVTPVVLVNAARMGLLGTAASVVVVTLIASAATSLGVGPIALVKGGMTAQLLTLQLFLATNFAMGLPVAMTIGNKRALQRELERARDLSRSMLENMREIIFRTDAEGRWQFLNPAWETITGHPVAEMIGKYAGSLVHPDDREAGRAAQRRMVSGEVDNVTKSHRFRHASGGYRTVEASVRALRDAAGNYAGSIGSVRDITEQQQAEQALSESQRLFQTLADFSPAGIVRSAADGSVTYCNQALYRLTGLSPEQAVAAAGPRRFTPKTPNGSLPNGLARSLPETITAPNSAS